MSFRDLPLEVRASLGFFILLTGLAVIGWFLWRCLRRSVDPARLAFRWLVTAGTIALFGYAIYNLASDGSAGGQIAGVLAGMVLGLVLAMLWLPAIVSRVSETIGSLYTGGSQPPVPTPAYSVAEAHRKQGRFKEAVYAVQEQLNRFPTDVTGQMMLAEIQAQDLRDLESASATIERFLSQDHAPRNIAFALTSLADWHLKLAGDSDASRAALQRIIDRLPETEEARTAAQRLAHFATPEELKRRQSAAPIPLKPGVRDLGLRSATERPAPPVETLDEAVARLTAQLATHPLDTDCRETLANLWAESPNHLEEAAAQFRHLADQPHQTPREAARWLHRLADLQILKGDDYEAVRTTLEEITNRFPDLAPAELARQRIETLRLELKGKQKSQVVRLGSYEKDLGLKLDPRSINPGSKPG